MLAKEKGRETHPETTMTMILEETSRCIGEPIPIRGPHNVVGDIEPIARRIKEMHLELHEMDINITTFKQQNIFVQTDIRGEIERTRDNPDMMCTFTR